FNALLKTLEEPPERCLFILATTEAHKLPATIQSRCQHFSFRLLDYAEILTRLKEICGREGVEAGEGALGLIAQAGEGSLRDALSLLDEAIAACGPALTEGAVRQMLGLVPAAFLAGLVGDIQAGDSRRVLERVEELASEGHDLAAFATELTRYIRNLMVARSCGADSPLIEVPDDERATLKKLAATLSEEDLTRFFQALLRAQNDLRYALQPRLHLELTLVKLAHAPKLVAVESLLAAVESVSKPSSSEPGRGGAGRPTSPQAPSAPPAATRTPAPPSRDVPRAPVPPWKRSDSARTAGPAVSPARERAPDSDVSSQSAAPAEPVQPARPAHAVQTPEREHLDAGSHAAAQRLTAAAPESESASPPASEDARLAAIKAVL
ncbi:MAG: hypothetical protein ACRDNM_16255, partial [Gaiellaceae bacterium]